MADVWVKRSDTSPVLALTLQDAAGDAVNIADAVCRLNMREMRSHELLIDHETMQNMQAGTEEEPTNVGEVQYAWATDDLDTHGGYYAEVEVTFAGGKVETFPNDGYITVAVVADLAEAAS